ncbi:MAG: insulinase family protein [Armatimonadetes bacterium]|nr:insulinase family protein [Armatimonadota bacterium]
MLRHGARAACAGAWFAFLTAALAAQKDVALLSKFELDNGLDVYVRAYPAAPTFAAAAVVDVSISEEPEGLEGVRSLLALCLVDSARRSLKQSGIAIDAEAKLDVLLVHATSLPAAWQQALAAVIDAVFHAPLDVQAVENRRAAMSEMEEAALTNAAVVASRAGLQALYPAMQRWARANAAYRPGAAHAVRRFYQQCFLPNRVTLAVSGPVTPTEVLEAVKRAVANLLPGAPATRASLSPEPARAGTQRINFPGADAAVWMGARAPAPDDPDYPSALVAVTLIGNGMGSQAFRRLRDELSLAYAVRAELVASRTCPYAYLVATCRAQDASRVAQEVNNIVAELISNGAPQAEVERAKEFAATQARLIEMSNLQAAAYIGIMSLLASDQPWSVSARALSTAIAAVTAGDVSRILRNWWSQRATIQVVGVLQG